MSSSRALVPLTALLLTVCSPAPPPSVRDATGSAAQPRTSPAKPARLHIEGTQFRLPDGTPFSWRGLTAFRLVELIAHGREEEAIALLDWAAAQQVTVLRAFVMAHHLFQLKPEEGRASLPRLLDLAAARGLYVEVVALADTAAIQLDFVAHMKALGSTAAAHDNAILEVANEPWHPSQSRHLHDPANVRKLAELVPAIVPVALGSVERNDGYAAGRYVTWHSPRATGENGWEHVTGTADGAALLAKWRKPLVSDEPMGAGPAMIPGRRDDNPARFGAAAAITHLAGLGATFHYEGGLQARTPAGVELACFNAWRSALDLFKDMPDGGMFVAGRELEKTAKIAGSRAAFGRIHAAEAWIIAVDPSDKAAISWTEGWRLQSTQGSEGIRLFRGRR